MNDVTPNERVNCYAVIGLMIIDLVLWLGIIVLHSRGPVDNAMVLAAGSIPAGLLGYINRDSKHPNSSSVNAPDATNVTVNNKDGQDAASEGTGQ